MYFQVTNLENARKDIFRDKQNNKQNTAHVFRCYRAYGKGTIILLDSVNKQARYSVCIEEFKNLKISSKQGQQLLQS